MALPCRQSAWNLKIPSKGEWPWIPMGGIEATRSYPDTKVGTGRRQGAGATVSALVPGGLQRAPLHVERLLDFGAK